MCGNFTAVGDGVNRKWILGGDSMDRFASQTLSGILDRYVMDKTGVDGLFNITLTFGIDASSVSSLTVLAPLSIEARAWCPLRRGSSGR